MEHIVKRTWEATTGFVYLWYDRKHKRYYVGSHWGDEDDGYVCSSRWMRKSYKRRPEDFKRRIIARVSTSKADLLKEEERWLQMMKVQEMKPINEEPRYYNLNRVTTHLWHADPERAKTVGERISKAKTGKPAKWKDPTERGRKISEGKKRKFAERLAATGSAFSEEHKAKIAASNSGKVQSEQTKKKRSDSLKLAYAEGRR